MPKVCRKGDVNNAGGAVSSIPQSSVVINGRTACVLGSTITPHPCCGDDGCGEHCSAVVSESDNNVIIEGIKVTHVTHGNSCGHNMKTGSPDVVIGSDT